MNVNDENSRIRISQRHGSADQNKIEIRRGIFFSLFSYFDHIRVYMYMKQLDIAKFVANDLTLVQPFLVCHCFKAKYYSPKPLNSRKILHQCTVQSVPVLLYMHGHPNFFCSFPFPPILTTAGEKKSHAMGDKIERRSMSCTLWQISCMQ
jgi:hypothetical protein